MSSTKLSQKLIGRLELCLARSEIFLVKVERNLKIIVIAKLIHGKSMPLYFMCYDLPSNIKGLLKGRIISLFLLAIWKIKASLSHNGFSK